MVMGADWEDRWRSRRRRRKRREKGTLTSTRWGLDLLLRCLTHVPRTVTGKSLNDCTLVARLLQAAGAMEGEGSSERTRDSLPRRWNEFQVGPISVW